jgi:hypothetical protein
MDTIRVQYEQYRNFDGTAVVVALDEALAAVDC